MAASDLTHYDVLGIARDADAATVRSAWKLHVQAWHPDRFSDDLRVEAERQTTRINEAYTALRDSSRRAAYDCRLAADEAEARPEPPRRSAYKTHPAAPRAAAAPVGSPMPLPEPMTLADQAAEIGRDAMRVVRRHPRVFAAAATLWVVVLGGSLVLHATTGPSLPTVSAQPVSAATLDAGASAAEVEDLEVLADRAREEADKADAELQQLMLEDARIAAAEDAAAARADRLAAAQAAKRGRTKPRANAPAGRVVRIMPKLG
jgi:hypothetical protein